MPKIKAFLVLTLLVAFSFSLFGCGLISGLTSGPEEVMTGQEGELPEWLLLAHRSDESAVIDNDADADPDDDSGTLTPPPPQETTAPATTAQAPAPAPTPEPEPASSTLADKDSPTGRMEISQAYKTLERLEKKMDAWFETNENLKPNDDDYDDEMEEMEKMQTQYAQIIKALYQKYGVTYAPDSPFGGGGFGDTWAPFD